MADLPIPDDDIEIDLDDDDTDLQTSVFLKETAVLKAVGTSDEITTRAATSGSSNSLLSLNAGTSEDKAIVIYNPSPNYQNTDENQYMDHPLSLFTAYDFHNWGVGWRRRWLGEVKKEVLFSCKVSRICKPTLEDRRDITPLLVKRSLMLSPLFAVKLSPLIKEFNETSLFNLATTGTPRPQSGDEGENSTGCNSTNNLSGLWCFQVFHHLKF